MVLFQASSDPLTCEKVGDELYGAEAKAHDDLPRVLHLVSVAAILSDLTWNPLRG